MRPNGDELEHIWEAFKREWKFPHWPIPSELCGRLTKFRQAQGSVRKAVGAMEHAASASNLRQVDHRRYNHGEFLDAVAKARAMASSPDPFTAALGRSLSRCADGLLRNRDDNDQPRYPESRE